MKALLIEDGVVVNIAKFDDDAEIPDGWVAATGPVGIGWTDDGAGGFTAPVKEEPVLTDAEKIAAYRAAVGLHIDQKAQQLGYDNVATAVGYADEPAVPKFQQEGQALRAWRSKVWEKCYTVLAEVEAEVRAAPTVDELIAELPTFTAP